MCFGNPPGSSSSCWIERYEEILRIRPITRTLELDQIRPEWQSLERKRPARNPFLTWEFMSLWWRHYGRPPAHHLQVLAGYEQDHLMGIAPFYLQKKGYNGTDTDCLCIIGDNIIAPDFLDCITAPDYSAPFMRAAARHIRSECQATRIELNGVSEKTVGDQSWQHFLRRLALNAELFESCPWMKLPADFATYEQSLSKGWRCSLKRKKRRLARNCPYQFEVFSGREAVRNLDRFIALNQQRLSDRRIDGGFNNQGFSAFHRDLAASLAPLGMIELHFLRADSGADIAGIYFFKDPESKYYYYYQQGFAKQFGIYSPGNILTANAIEFAISQSAAEFHFLRGAEAYKYRWTQESLNILSLQGCNENSA